jgi:hypothetical protein
MIEDVAGPAEEEYLFPTITGRPMSVSKGPEYAGTPDGCLGSFPSTYALARATTR